MAVSISPGAVAHGRRTGGEGVANCKRCRPYAAAEVQDGGGSFGDDDDNDTLLVRSTKKVGGEGSIGARAEALLVHTYLARYM